MSPLVVAGLICVFGFWDFYYLEPTSAIDAKGEYEIFQRIAQTQQDKSSLIVSHRFSTVRQADRILVLAGGRVTENGTHEELMKIKGGTYHELFSLQAEAYK
jgi:ATP-binding cassette subfamily B protein